MKMRIVLLPALAFATACAMGKSEQKSETRTAQDQAHQALQQAADAQKRAADEEAKAEKMQNTVTQKQKELAEAQAQLRGQRVKAEQAQRDAEQLTKEAQREATTSQQQALQTQQTETQQMRQVNQRRTQEWTQEKNLRGRVVQAGRNSLQVRTRDQGLVQLQANDSTAVTLDGHTAQLSQIQPGSDVRASYQEVDGKATALHVDVTTRDQSSSQSDNQQTPPQSDTSSHSPQQPDTSSQSPSK